MLLRLSRSLPAMGSNSNRFIPENWFRPAHANRQIGNLYRHSKQVDFTEDDNWWQHNAVEGYYRQYYYPQAFTTGAHQTYSNIRRLPQNKNAGQHDGGTSSPKISRKDHRKHEKSLDKNGQKEETHEGSVQQTNQPNRARDHSKEKSFRSGRQRFSPSSFSATSRHGRSSSTSGKRHGQHSSQFHTWRRYSDKSKQVVSGQPEIPTPSSSSEKSGNRNRDDQTSHQGTNSAKNETGVDEEFIYQLERNWEDIDPPNEFSECQQLGKKQIRIVSYNILSQKLLTLNNHLYKNCKPEILQWKYRWPKLKAEIEKFDADILCLQEVEECHYKEDILSFLEKLNYGCNYKRRTSNSPYKPDGVLIAFKKHHFELCLERKVEYYRGNTPPVNQDNVAVITLLKPVFHDTNLNRDSCICFVNTHLLYNPRRGDIKLAQLTTLFSEIHDILKSRTRRKIPVVMCGDFNSVPRSYLFNFITKEQIDYKGVESRDISGQKTSRRGRTVYVPSPLLPECMRISGTGCAHDPQNREDEPESEILEERYKLRHGLGPLFSAHSHDKPEASTTQDEGVTVDYIFHSPYENTKDELSIYPTKRLSLINPCDLQTRHGIPNAVHPSDHLPVVADFTLVLH